MKVAWTSALAAVAIGSAAVADSPMQPPMINFRQAFYTCDNGGAFMISYDGNPAARATVTTSNDNKHYPLKRTKVASGIELDGGGVKFWTDAKTVTVDGTQTVFRNCQVKPG